MTPVARQHLLSPLPLQASSMAVLETRAERLAAVTVSNFSSPARIPAQARRKSKRERQAEHRRTNPQCPVSAGLPPVVSNVEPTQAAPEFSTSHNAPVLCSVAHLKQQFQ